MPHLYTLIIIAMLNLTTIQYLNLPVRTNGYSNGLFDSDEDDFYYTDSEDSDAMTVRKRTLKLEPRGFGYSMYRKVIHKLRRTWILIMRTFVPNYKYRRLNQTQKRDGCLNWFKRPQLLPMTFGKKQRTKCDTANFRTRDDVNMEEFFARKTIRPIITMDGEEIDQGPNYDDDMGLDFTALDVYSEDEDEEPKKIDPKQRVSKAARLLDIPEEETLAQQQRLVTAELKNDETELYEL